MNVARNTQKASRPYSHYYNDLPTIIVERKDNNFHRNDQDNIKKNVEEVLKTVEDGVIDGLLDE